MVVRGDIGLRGRLPVGAGRLSEEVERAERIRVRFRSSDRNGKRLEFDADGLLAVCIQHEIDHLNGKLFVDYLSDLKRYCVTKKFAKAAKQREAE